MTLLDPVKAQLEATINTVRLQGATFSYAILDTQPQSVAGCGAIRSHRE